MAGKIALLPHDTRHYAVLRGFLTYCHDHPDERFWQALRNWSGYDYIVASSDGYDYDTFYWEGRNKNYD
jgi:hypothetical protein